MSAAKHQVSEARRFDLAAVVVVLDQQARGAPDVDIGDHRSHTPTTSTATRPPQRRQRIPLAATDRSSPRDAGS
jgi:hypothetical protein